MLRFKPKRRVVFLALLILVVVFFFKFGSTDASPPLEHLNILQRRKQYSNSIQVKENDNLESKCVSYFRQMSKLNRPGLEEQFSHEHDGLLFKKTKWLREAGRIYRKETRRKHQRFAENYELLLLEKFYKKSAEASRLEEGFVNDMAHMRAFGKCFLENTKSLSRQAKLCEKATSTLLPFLLGELPRIDFCGSSPDSSVRSDDLCFVKLLMRMDQGDGIVIPILPRGSRSQQLVRAVRMIKVLRATNNTLPIEIVMMDDKPVRKDLKDDLILAAKRDDMKVPESYLRYLGKSSKEKVDLPKQNIRFVYLERAIDKRFFTLSDPLTMTLAPLLCSFQRAIVLSTQTIPLTRDFLHVLDSSDVKNHGTKFYKSRAIQEQKLTKYPPGYFETNDLVNQLADVGSNETLAFGVKRSRNLFTKRVRSESYTQLLDTSMFVVDKLKALSGLLISAALHYYPIIRAKYDFRNDNFESLWLGQELAGNIEYVPFNPHFAIAAGLLTPPENVQVGPPSRELCSSSWAQLSEVDDTTLLLVTTHQIENRVLPDFNVALKEKYLTKTTLSEVDYTIHEQKLKRNPLRIETLLRPIVVDERIYNRDQLVELPWVQESLFGSLDDYWCAYDIVGTTSLPNRGVVTDLNEEQQLWYNSLIEIWLLSSHQQSSSMVSYE